MQGRTLTGIRKMATLGLAGVFALFFISCSAPTGTGSTSTVSPTPSRATQPVNQQAQDKQEEKQPAAQQPPQEISVKLTYGAVSGSSSPLWVAQREGLFDKYGLAVNMSYVQTNTALGALAAGDVQLSTASAQTIDMDLAGADIVYIASAADYFIFSIYGQPEISSPQNLKGKTIGVTQAKAATDLALRAYLKSIGLDPDKDVKITYMRDMSAIVTSLSQKLVDAGVLSAPSTLRARSSGMHEIVNLGKLKLPFTHTEIATTRRFIKENPEAVRRFIKAYIEAIKIVKDQPKSAYAAIGQYAKLDDQSIVQESYQEFAGAFGRVPYVSKEAVQAVLDFSDNPKAKAAKPEDYIDNSFIEELDKVGFIRDLYGGRVPTE